MKTFLLHLCITLTLCASELTVIGLSGSKYTVPLTKSSYVDITLLLRKLNIRHTISGDSLNVKYDKSKMSLVSGDSLALLDSSEIAINSKIHKKKSSFNIKPLALPKLLSPLTGLSFRYSESRVELSIHREPAEYLDLTGRVVIDPGHGGKDPGAIGQNGSYEKDAVLAISLKAADYLKENSGITVHLTRDDDTFVPLGERTAFANDSSADLFVSVHANSSPKKDKVGGYKMYFLSDAKNENDDRIASMENASIQFEEQSAGADILQTVLRDMINNEFLKESQELSIDLEKTFRDGLDDVGVLHTGVGQANFYVLNGALMPAVLVEVAFISNTKEEALLSEEDFQNQAAMAIGKAILKFRAKQRSSHE